MRQAYFGRKSRKLVQGEDMKKRLELYRRGSLPVYWLFFFGFLAGVVIPNVMWKYEWHQKTAASLYLLAVFADNSLDKGEYFLQVLKMRGSVFLISALCGVSVFGAPLAVMGILYMGVRTGLLLTMSILQFGLQGGIVGLGALFPRVPLILSLLFLADVADIPAVFGNLEEPWADCRRGILLCVSRSFMRGGLYGRNFAGNLVQSSGYGGSDEKPGAFLK